MKTKFFYFLLAISLVLAACEPKEKPEESYKPTTDPVAETLTDIKEVYNSYKACLHGNYATGMTITLKREDKTTEDFAIDELEYFNEDGEAVSTLIMQSKDWNIALSLYAYLEGGKLIEEGFVDIYRLSDEDNGYTCETLVIHSKDKIYLKDEESGQYICVLQKGKGILYLEDNAGHTWEYTNSNK